MKKSEMIRQAAARVLRFGRRENDRVCYCTPTRNMVISLNDEVCMNELSGHRRATASELMTTVAEKIREALGRTEAQSLPLEHLDRDRAVSDEIVTEAFEKAALMYEERGE